MSLLPVAYPVVLDRCHPIETVQASGCFGKLSLSLVNHDVHSRLVVSGCREHLAFLGWYSCISRNLNSTDTTHQTKGKRVTSRRSIPTDSSFAKIPPWIAAPKATTSSGFTDWFGFLPKKFVTFSRTRGIRVDHQPKSLRQCLMD